MTVPDDALQSIAACSQLKRLKVVNTGPLALEGKNLECIMQLTQLTGLEALSFYGGSKHAGSRRCQRYHLVSSFVDQHCMQPPGHVGYVCLSAANYEYQA